MKNKLIYALLSFVIALGLWFYVIAVVSPESEEIFYNIPVVLQNESVLNEKGFMIATQEKPTVTLRLRGNRSDLNKLTSSDILLTVDMSKINRVGKQYLSIDTDFPGSFAITSQVGEVMGNFKRLDKHGNQEAELLDSGSTQL